MLTFVPAYIKQVESSIKSVISVHITVFNMEYVRVSKTNTYTSLVKCKTLR